MSNFFVESAEELQPRENVRIVQVKATPYPDGVRVRVEIRLTPFQERPSLEIRAQQIGGAVVAQMSVIETMTPALEFTLHLRGVDDPAGTYVLTVDLYYDDYTNPQHRQETTFQVAKTA